jgi:hypothetical protein
VRNLTLLAFLAFIALGFVMITMTTGCSKGNAGPAGPAGPDSVQYSGWTTLAMAYAKIDPSSGDSLFAQTITASSITSTILNQGAVIGYMLQPDPLTGDSSIINASLALVEFFNVGNIDLVSYGVNLSGNLYRYVVIPSKITTTDASGTLHTYTASQLKNMNYSDLTKILAIPAKGSSAQFSSHVQ